ncbi:hypothetical protein SAMN03159316_1350 [Pseudomonas sp. NFR02]|uniref:phage tail fiber protein n=1 Tax=Pseudomonas sp. NFR02 TaxID=1566229 RepID=UPI0009146038|nr:hypothetical protein [Pseudomonas sp. NFR02]SFX26827.1 hypothetical protein SAMN03159316_1350 [Pseudomonas sp. NFR02]
MSSWFAEGTVTVNNGNAVVTGVGTKFSNCRSGDMFVGPDNGIYQVINPSSDTSVSISPAYRGATSAGAAYGIVPVNGYPKALADAVNLMVQQWGATLAGLGTVSTENVVPISKGGTGDTTATGARGKLGLGSAATLTAGSASGNVMLMGDRGSQTVASLNTWGNSFQLWNANTAGAPAQASGTVINAAFPEGNFGSQIIMSFSGKMWFRSGDYANASTREVYHTGNTTRGSGGALSAASPIMRIACVATSERRDLQEETFAPAGDWGVVNSEARGVTVQRMGVGEYKIAGSLGLALEGWRTHDPSSPDGGRMLGITDSHQDEDGTVTVRLFKQRWTLTEDGEMLSGRGAPMDVPLNSWIDVRLEMPKAEVPPPIASTEE